MDTASYSRVLLDAALLHWSFLERRTTPNIQNVTTWTMEVQLCCQMNTNVVDLCYSTFEYFIVNYDVPGYGIRP